MKAWLRWSLSSLIFTSLDNVDCLYSELNKIRLSSLTIYTEHTLWMCQEKQFLQYLLLRAIMYSSKLLHSLQITWPKSLGENSRPHSPHTCSLDISFTPRRMFTKSSNNILNIINNFIEIIWDNTTWAWVLSVILSQKIP